VSYGTWGISPTIRHALGRSSLQRRSAVEDDFRRQLVARNPLVTSRSTIGQQRGLSSGYRRGHSRYEYAGWTPGTGVPRMRLLPAMRFNRGKSWNHSMTERGPRLPTTSSVNLRVHADRSLSCKAVDRGRGWQIVKAASELADLGVFTMGATAQGAVGEPARVHSHLLRHVRVRPRQAEYLFLSDDEAQRLMPCVPE
jgi:hypothetical protein